MKNFYHLRFIYTLSALICGPELILELIARKQFLKLGRATLSGALVSSLIARVPAKTFFVVFRANVKRAKTAN